MVITHPLARAALTLVLVVAVVLICRWVFSTKERDRRSDRQVPATWRQDYGLLVPVASARTPGAAEALSGVLRAAGIRCTLADGDPGGERVVLVFPQDAERARLLVRS